MPVTWKDYVGIRRIDLSEFIKIHNIKTYEDLLKHVEKGDVLPPTREEASSFLGAEGAFSGVISKKDIAQKEKEKKLQEYDWTASKKVDISKRKPRRSRRKSAPKEK